jgi:hypothetical protein
MAQTNRIHVEVYPAHEEFDAAEALIFEDVNYISFVSSPGGAGEGTYGIPAKIAEDSLKREGLPATILYVNPANIAAMKAVREA